MFYLLLYVKYTIEDIKFVRENGLFSACSFNRSVSRLKLLQNYTNVNKSYFQLAIDKIIY